MPTIKVELSERGIDDILQRLESLKTALSDLSKPVERLCQQGEKQAGDILANAHASFDGPRDSTVSSVVSGNSGAVTMQGQGAPFIEFGAGVHFNGTESYPLPRPAGIVGIGEYGLGQGKRDRWRYGHKWTYGTPAAKPLYFASLVMEQNAPAEFKAVIDDALK